ncbi:MAG: RNA polymerase sigma factor, partial [Rheinheimera sp.]
LNIQQFEHKAQFSTWLLRIAFFEMLQAKRTEGIFSRLKQRWFSGLTETMVHTDATEQQLDAEQLIAGLSALQQQVFVYTEFYGYSQTEIADKLQLPLGSVKTYLKQARDSLSEEQSKC